MFTIDQEKLQEVIRIFNAETDPSATDEVIKAEVLGDWHAEKHQDWLGETDAQEIADWLASFYSS